VATTRTYSDVLSRAQALLNDSGAQYWNITTLLPHLSNAQNRVFSEIAKYSTVEFRKVATGLIYVLGTSDITAILPADLYQPEKLEWRLNTSEEWQEVERRVAVPSNELSANQADRVIYWAWRSRTILTNKCTQGGLLQLTYFGLLADPTGTSSNILMDNVVEALAYFTAMDAYARRGQVGQVDLMANMGGTQLDNLISHIVQNEQFIQRRGKRFSARC